MIRPGIQVMRGVEGPREDPWGYTRVTVRISGVKSTKIADLKMGLGCDGRFTVINDNGETSYNVTHDEEKARSLFLKLVGLTFDQAIKVRSKYDNRPKCACGPRYLEWVRGYPAEELLVCRKCGSVSGVSFNESEVM